MGRRGPKPLPGKLLNSWRAKERLAAERAPPGTPEPPEYIRRDAEALACWHELVGHLTALGTLSPVDSVALAALAQLAAAHRQFARELRENEFIGEDGEVNPALGPFFRATALLRQHAAEFGLTPASRAGLRVGPQEDDTTDTFFNWRTTAKHEDREAKPSRRREPSRTKKGTKDMAHGAGAKRAAALAAPARRAARV